MIPTRTGPDCISLMHGDRLLRDRCGPGFESGDELPTACGQRRGDEPDGAIAVRHALPHGPHGLVASYSRGCRELLTCDVSDLVRPARRNRRALQLQRSPDAFRVTLDASATSGPSGRRRCTRQLMVSVVRSTGAHHSIQPRLSQATGLAGTIRRNLTRALTRLRYCALRPLRRWRDLSHFGASPNSPMSHKTKPPIARMTISPAIRNRRITQVD